MLRAWFLLLVLAVASAPDGASAAAGELVSNHVSSQFLKRDFPYVVYLPDGYSDGGQRYPVVYLLHGAGDDQDTWQIRGHIKEMADEMIARGIIPPSILVMPGCTACWWVDSPHDNAESAFWNDLVPAIDSRYRTIPRRDGRFIAGTSAGGYGAIRYGFKYPDRVSAIGALSPAIYADLPPPTSSARLQPPFKGRDGKFSDSAWALRNYPTLIAGYYAQPKRVNFFLLSGDDDRLGTAFEAALLHRLISARQPGMCELRVLDGEHSWTLWAAALPEVLRNVLRQAPGLVAAKSKSTVQSRNLVR